MTTIPLTTCTLRPWRHEDAESLIWHADDIRVAANLREGFPSPYTRADAEAWLARTVDESPYFNFAIDVDGEAVGGIGLRLGGDAHRYHGEIGYWLGVAYWDRGIATEAVRAITEYGLERFDLRRVYALVFASNVASVRVLEKNGYVLQGQLPDGLVNRGQVVEALVYAFDAED